MCDRAADLIARKAIAAAQAEWELIMAIQAEAQVHGGVVTATRQVLAGRGDAMALDVFEWALKPAPDMEKARALVDSAEER
jgi:hypothetical protein